MEAETVSVRDLRLNFRAVERKIEKGGRLVVTKRGVPTFIIESLPAPKKRAHSPPDYWARLMRRKGKALTDEGARALWDENRGER